MSNCILVKIRFYTWEIYIKKPLIIATPSGHVRNVEKTPSRKPFALSQYLLQPHRSNRRESRGFLNWRALWRGPLSWGVQNEYLQSPLNYPERILQFPQSFPLAFSVVVFPQSRLQIIPVCLFFYMLKSLVPLKLGLFPNAKVSPILKDFLVGIVFPISF